MRRSLFEGEVTIDVSVQGQAHQLIAQLRMAGVPVAGNDTTPLPGYELTKQHLPGLYADKWRWKKLVPDDVKGAAEPFQRLWGQEPLVLASEANSSPADSVTHVVAEVLLGWQVSYGDHNEAWDAVCRLLQGEIS